MLNVITNDHLLAPHNASKVKHGDRVSAFIASQPTVRFFEGSVAELNRVASDVYAVLNRSVDRILASRRGQNTTVSGVLSSVSPSSHLTLLAVKEVDPLVSASLHVTSVYGRGSGIRQRLREHVLGLADDIGKILSPIAMYTFRVTDEQVGQSWSVVMIITPTLHTRNALIGEKSAEGVDLSDVGNHSGVMKLGKRVSELALMSDVLSIL